MKRAFSFLALLLPIAMILVACGGVSNNSSSNGGTQGQPASVFVTGEDAPLPSVLSFNVTINSITLNGKNGSPQVLSQPTTVDFARLLGLRTMLAFNSVPADTYSGATFQLASPAISYLDMSTTPPSVGTINGTLTTSAVTTAFPTPLVVGSTGLAGVRMEFDLRKSLALDATGQVTGSVNPQISLLIVQPTDVEGQITDLIGTLISVNTSSDSLVIQGPHGHQFTIDVNAQTQFNGNWNIDNLVTPAYIAAQGTVQGDGSILASAVEVVSTSQAFLSGRIIALNPTSGPVQTVTIVVGEEMPAMSNAPVGLPITLDVSQVSTYDICFFGNWFTNLLFDNSSMVVGQRLFIGGSFDSGANTFTPSMISLRLQGVHGDLVSNSVSITSGNRGSFQLQNNNMLGYVLGAPMTVQTGNATNFMGVNGLSGIQSGGSMSLVAGGLVLKDPVSGNPQLWAGRVRVLP
jgi:hypothetical protein